MAVTFAGKQPGYADPKMRHEPALPACSFTVIFKGVSAGYAAPTVSGCIPKYPGIDKEWDQ